MRILANRMDLDLAINSDDRTLGSDWYFASSYILRLTKEYWTLGQEGDYLQAIELPIFVW